MLGKCIFRWPLYFFRIIFVSDQYRTNIILKKQSPQKEEKANQNHPKRAKKQRRNTTNTPEEEKRTPKLQAKGPSQKSHEPSIAMEDDLAIFKLDR